MHTQKVCNRPLKPLQGVAVVLGIFAVLFVLTFITQLIAPFTGEVSATIVFWGVGALVALWTMRRFVLSYSYALGTNVIRVSHAYGRYERVMVDLYFNNILNAGSLDDMRARYPGARVNRATRPGCDIEPLAVAARDNGVTAIYLLQPDEVIREKLEETARKNRRAK